MKAHFSEKYDTWFNWLGAYQFFGGLLGLGMTVYSIYGNGFRSIPLLAIFILFFLFYGFSVVCGWLCLRQKDMALSLSYINQCLQLVSCRWWLCLRICFRVIFCPRL
jgi:O-antigen/teichoic acid export membrane protein